MPFACPRCSARIDADEVAGAMRCGACGSALYVDPGGGFPHRIVSRWSEEREIRRRASDWLRRAGREARVGRVTIYLIPYFVLQERLGTEGWQGRAAIEVASPAIERIDILGSETSWFDPMKLPPGATLLDPTRDPSEAAGASKIRELRHVPIAHVECEDGTEPGALWIDAERCRVLGVPPEVRPGGGPPGRIPWWVIAEAIGIGIAAVVLPPVWSFGIAAAAAVGLALAARAGLIASTAHGRRGAS